MLMVVTHILIDHCKNHFKGYEKDINTIFGFLVG